MTITYRTHIGISGSHSGVRSPVREPSAVTPLSRFSFTRCSQPPTSSVHLFSFHIPYLPHFFLLLFPFFLMSLISPHPFSPFLTVTLLPPPSLPTSLSPFSYHSFSLYLSSLTLLPPPSPSPPSGQVKRCTSIWATRGFRAPQTPTRRQRALAVLTELFPAARDSHLGHVGRNFGQL